MSKVNKFLFQDPASGAPKSPFINFIRFKVEPVIEYALYIVGMLAIIIGSILSLVVAYKDIKRGYSKNETVADVRITLSEFISLGLTFILGAEVVKMFRVPNIFQLIKVALLVLLRQLITHFLDMDVQRLRKQYPDLGK